MTKNTTVEALPPQTQPVGLGSGFLRLQVSLLMGLFVLLYGRITGSLVLQWWTQEESSHGFLILPICLIILWAKRRELDRLPVEPAWKAGMPVMGAAGLLLILGQVGGILALSQISMLLMLVGLVITLLGVRFLSNLRFPMSYLLFMLPSISGALLIWNWQFQLVTARMGVFLLQLLAVPAQLDENHIILPNMILRVASSCSGVRYLVSILALALPLGYLILRRLRHRIALAVLALIIGIAANWMRVVFIGLWAYYGGTVVHGPFHVFQALSVAWVAFAGLFFVTWLLSRSESRQLACVVESEERFQVATEQRPGFSRLWNYAWAQAVLLLLAVFAYLSVYNRGPVPLKQEIATFPSRFGQWAELRTDRQAPILRAEGADHELYRIYVGRAKQPVHLYVAYFEHQTQAKEVVSYVMAPVHQGALALVVTSRQSGVGVDHELAANNFENCDVIFWYHINGRILANRLAVKASTIWDALTRGRTNGALVMVYRERHDTPQELDSELKKFGSDVLPVLREYLP